MLVLSVIYRSPKRFNSNTRDAPSKSPPSLSPNEGAVVPGQLAVGAAAVKGDATDAAGVVVGHPLPRRYSVPALDRHLKEITSGTLKPER